MSNILLVEYYCFSLGLHCLLKCKAPWETEYPWLCSLGYIHRSESSIHWKYSNRKLKKHFINGKQVDSDAFLRTDFDRMLVTSFDLIESNINILSLMCIFLSGLHKIYYHLCEFHFPSVSWICLLSSICHCFAKSYVLYEWPLISLIPFLPLSQQWVIFLNLSLKYHYSKG